MFILLDVRIITYVAGAVIAPLGTRKTLGSRKMGIQGAGLGIQYPSQTFCLKEALFEWDLVRGEEW